MDGGVKRLGVQSESGFWRGVYEMVGRGRSREGEWGKEGGWKSECMGTAPLCPSWAGGREEKRSPRLNTAFPFAWDSLTSFCLLPSPLLHSRHSQPISSDRLPPKAFFISAVGCYGPVFIPTSAPIYLHVPVAMTQTDYNFPAPLFPPSQPPSLTFQDTGV